jgi:hypothetical protein
MGAAIGKRVYSRGLARWIAALIACGFQKMPPLSPKMADWHGMHLAGVESEVSLGVARTDSLDQRHDPVPPPCGVVRQAAAGDVGTD